MHRNFTKNKNLTPLFSKTLYIVFLLSVSLLIQSCSEQENKNVKSITQFIPQAKRDYSADKTQTNQKTNNADTLKTAFVTLFKSFSNGEKFDVIQKAYYPDRFGPKESWKIQLKTDSSTSSLACWVFSDSIKTQNAFYNWMDCFGSDCKELKIGERIRINENNGEIWLKDTLLIYWNSIEKNISPAERRAVNNFMSDTLKYHLRWKKGHYNQWIGLKSQ